MSSFAFSFTYSQWISQSDPFTGSISLCHSSDQNSYDGCPCHPESNDLQSPTQSAPHSAPAPLPLSPVISSDLLLSSSHSLRFFKQGRHASALVFAVTITSIQCSSHSREARGLSSSSVFQCRLTGIIWSPTPKLQSPHWLAPIPGYISLLTPNHYLLYIFLIYHFCFYYFYLFSFIRMCEGWDFCLICFVLYS